MIIKYNSIVLFLEYKSYIYIYIYNSYTNCVKHLINDLTNFLIGQI